MPWGDKGDIAALLGGAPCPRKMEEGPAFSNIDGSCCQLLLRFGAGKLLASDLLSQGRQTFVAALKLERAQALLSLKDGARGRGLNLARWECAQKKGKRAPLSPRASLPRQQECDWKDGDNAAVKGNPSPRQKP